MTQQFVINKNFDNAIDDALRTFPSEDAPDTLLPMVMSRVQAVASIPRFRLTWFDYAISLFGAGMAGIIFLIWRFFPQPPLIEIVPNLIAQLGHPDLLYFSAIILGGTALIIGAVLTTMLLFSLQCLPAQTTK